MSPGFLFDFIAKKVSPSLYSLRSWCCCGRRSGCYPRRYWRVSNHLYATTGELCVWGVWHAPACHPQRWPVGAPSVDRATHSIDQVRSRGAWFVGIQSRPAAVEHVSTPLFCCYAGKVAECFRDELYISLRTGQRGHVIHSRYETGADERRLQVPAGVQSELLHPWVRCQLMQPLLSPRPNLLHGMLNITANSLQPLLLSQRKSA